MLRIILTLLFISAISSQTKAQISFEGQLGGANFLGISLNTRFEIPLNKEGNHRISPQLGLGIMIPGWADPIPLIIHSGLHYQFKRFGIGAELSGFTANPYFRQYPFYYNDFVDILLYPNINYVLGKGRWYYRISAGAYFAYSYYYDNSGTMKLDWEGDVIPGAGLSVGYRF